MNNKGVSVIEILVSFVLISIVLIGMMNVVYLYRGKISTSNYRKQLITYKNKLTRDIYNDINTMKIYSINKCSSNSDKCIELKFGINASSLVTKKLEISDDNIRDKYIAYGGEKYKIYEELPSSGDNLERYESIKFTNNKIILIEDNLGTDVVYHIDIGINHVDMIDDFGIHITAIRGL